MKLTQALTLIRPSAEKTAAVAPLPVAGTQTPVSDAADMLKQALAEATATSTTKTASMASPVEDITKIAADLSKAEHDALVKEAQLYGAAVCDGFMARAAQYEEATRKTAGTVGTTSYEKTANDESFEKFAAENPDLVKEAMSLGYNTTLGQLEKLAEDAYAKGWNDTIQQVYKTACDAFVAGFKNGHALVEAASR